jgi:hypothetical protein
VIVVSGFARGEIISLTLAPVQLLAMLLLVWTGGGRNALEQHVRLESKRNEGSVGIIPYSQWVAPNRGHG